ncbi:MAG: YdiY family protein [Betaproteobacteria bacterium]
MNLRRIVSALSVSAAVSASAAAQTAAPPADPAPPPPLWDAQVGASFVGTSGNSQTSSFGADFAAHRRGAVWQIDSNATAVRASSGGLKTAERYIAGGRGQRALTPLLKLTVGERAERDQLSGLDFRNVLDAGLGWALVRGPGWTLDGTTSLAWNHEQRAVGTNLDDPVGVLQLLSRLPIGAAGETTQRFTYYPDFRNTSAYRSEAELAVQAAMNSRLALKFGYLLRYANDPVPGFKKTDNTATASVVLQWRSVAPAPTPGGAGP